MARLVLIIAFALAATAADAAPKPKRSFESCSDLAQQRGFTGGNTVNIRAKRDFIRGCMSGKQS